jgi:hypothetical protein
MYKNAGTNTIIKRKLALLRPGVRYIYLVVRFKNDKEYRYDQKKMKTWSCCHVFKVPCVNWANAVQYGPIVEVLPAYKAVKAVFHSLPPD